MKNKIRVLSLIMALALILSSLVIVTPVSAEEDVEELKPIVESDGQPWTKDEFVADSFAGGDGSKDNPYQIATAGQLALLAVWSNDAINYVMTQRPSDNKDTKDVDESLTRGFFVLTADIDLAGHEWVAISQRSGTSPDMRFKGHFDGQGHTIKNLTVTPATEITTAHQQTGLFGYLGGSAIVENFTLTGSIDIDNQNHATSNVAMVVAEVSGFSTIQNVDVYGEVDVMCNKSNTLVAGIVAKANNAIINNCTMNGSVMATGLAKDVIPYVAGITARATGGLQINGCVNNADITVRATESNSIAAGIVAACGAITGDSDIVKYGTYITDTVNNGTVKSEATPGVEKGKGPNNQRIGGIIGNLGRDSNSGTDPLKPYMVNVELVRCTNTGTIALGSNVTKGSGSGICSFIGIIESKTKVTPYESCAIKLEDCFAYYGSSSRVEPFYYTSNKAMINGQEVAAGTFGTPLDSDVNLAVDVTEVDDSAIVRISKSAIKGFVGAGYTLVVNYGETEIAVNSIDELFDNYEVTEEDRCYAITLSLEKGKEASMYVTQTLFADTDVESTHTVNAKAATWSDFYTENIVASNTLAGEPGSAENPYIIATAGNLASLSDRIAKFDKTLIGKHFTILRDIDLSAHEWMPIGLTQPDSSPNNGINGGYAPSGTILGNNHVISGVNLTEKTYYNYTQSFFGYSKWDVSDLTFDGVKIRTPEVLPTNGTINGANALIGAMYGGSLSNVHVKNLDYVYKNTSGTELYTAGMVGYLTGGSTITGCSVSGSMSLEVLGSCAKIAAVASRGRNGSIVDTVADVDITVTADNDNKETVIGVGGFVGLLQCDDASETVTIRNCINAGDITLNYTDNGKSMGVGGFLGNADSKGSFVLSGSINCGVIALTGEGAAKAGKGAFIGLFNSNGNAAVNRCTSLVEEAFCGEDSSSALNVADSQCIDLDLEITDRASARLEFEDLDKAGLAFIAYANEDIVNLLKNQLGYEVTFGTVIATKDAFVQANGDVSALNAPHHVIDYTKDLVDGTFGGAIVNMGKENLGTEYCAVAYITISKNAAAYTIYSEFDQEKATSVLKVMENVLNDRKTTIDENETVYVNVTNEGDFSPYTQELLDQIKAVYFPVVAVPKA